MYYEHFGFRHPPFRITPDTSLFFPGGNRGAILEALGYAIRNGEGIIKVVGEVGSGKTMLCRMLELELPQNVEIVYLANPRLSPDNILQAIAFELKLPVADTDNRLQVMQSLQQYLLERHADNKQVVMFVEEAQAMPLATLEEIRLLSNLETNQHKLLQIVLFGQPELDDMLAKPQIRQLKERITYHFNLESLRHAEIRDYLNARLRSSGYRGQNLFTAAAINRIARYSRGLLRRVNILADKALLAAFADNARRIGRRQVMAAVRDSEFRLPWTHYLMPAMLALLFLAAGMFAYQQADRLLPVLPQQAPLAVDDADDPASQHQPRVGREPLPADNVWARVDPYAGIATEQIKPMEEKLSPADGTSTSFTDSIMRQQLSKLPPEEVWLEASQEPGATCKRCTAIIYRPLQGTEKL
ncbi:type II secretory pathway predicted ATPase ExeA [Methylohalomonas lacus]|uniref:Type II secretory pathway predicted ATPase ExeA n=1 Tax=Methylohalomonas lacus TaxID=398773 RepID=A0AAE3HM85_9GAMM|nr:AAA family ATPase [Methylohalomonas lacus]MCS3904415.1 type II secretory pathway predicted ATPase ExeA [Methylohalomonas lacus]